MVKEGVADRMYDAASGIKVCGGDMVHPKGVGHVEGDGQGNMFAIGIQSRT